MHPHLSSMFIQVTSIYPTLFIHIYYLHSSKCHPCIQRYPSKIIYIHLNLNPLTSMYPYVFIHIYLGIQHHSFIHITSVCPLFNDIHSSSNPLLSTFIHFPSTFSYTFIHDYLLGCYQQCSSTLFYPHPQFIYFNLLFIHITLHSCMSMYFYTIHPFYLTFRE
jgi:hypothetical protein